MTRNPLIYILGVGRSGSTLLERALASIPGAAAMGEVHQLWRRPLADLTCSCGAPAADCAVWSETLRRAGIGDEALESLRSLEASAIRHKRILRSALSPARFAKQPDVREFLKRQDDLMAAFAEAANARLLIDSSKAAPRAWALAAWPETRFIHLSRNRAEVAASWAAGKHDPGEDGPMPERPPRAQRRERIVTTWSARLLARRVGMARLTYEDLAEDPRAALTAALGPGLTGAIAWRGERRFDPGRGYHSIGGNPDRFAAGQVEIRAPAGPMQAAA